LSSQEFEKRSDQMSVQILGNLARQIVLSHPCSAPISTLANYTQTVD
jgi:hypothetical protein